jgi:hypothetical protein
VYQYKEPGSRTIHLSVAHRCYLLKAETMYCTIAYEYSLPLPATFHSWVSSHETYPYQPLGTPCPSSPLRATGFWTCPSPLEPACLTPHTPTSKPNGFLRPPPPPDTRPSPTHAAPSPPYPDTRPSHTHAALQLSSRPAALSPAALSRNSLPRSQGFPTNFEKM